MQSTYLNYALRQLEAIVNIPSPSGFTAEAVRYCSNEFANMAIRLRLHQRAACLSGLAAMAKGFCWGRTSTLWALWCAR